MTRIYEFRMKPVVSYSPNGQRCLAECMVGHRDWRKFTIQTLVMKRYEHTFGGKGQSCLAKGFEHMGICKINNCKQMNSQNMRKF